MSERAEMDENTALAALFAYKRRTSAEKDYLAMSNAVRSLLGIDKSSAKERKSLAMVKKMTGYSTETLRALASLKELPTEVQDLIKAQKLGYEAHKILSINDSTSETQEGRRIELGKGLVGLGTDDSRALIEYVKKNPKLSVEQCKRSVLESKTVKRKVYMVVAELEEDPYLKLKERAMKDNISVDESVRRIVSDWLKENYNEQ